MNEGGFAGIELTGCRSGIVRIDGSRDHRRTTWRDVDQHQPLNAIRMPVRVKHGNPAAERMADQGEARQSPSFDHGTQILVEVLHLVALLRVPGAVAMAALVERDDVIA